VLKGICHLGDARRAVDEGIDGIYVSTHGGWQANGGLAAIDCLADVAEAVPGVPVLFDSGVRCGSDVVRRSHSAPRQLGSAATTPTAPRQAAPTASCTCSGRSWRRPTC